MSDWAPGDMASVTRTAVISPDGRYRYRLGRSWGDGEPTMCFIMLNPSTADATIDDPTIRRCMSFAAREGCEAIDVVNLFAYRTPSPKELLRARRHQVDIEGPDNYDHLHDAVTQAHLTVAAWGAWPETHGGVPPSVPGMYDIHCLGKTRRGSPRHPLYLPAITPLELWWTGP